VLASPVAGAFLMIVAVARLATQRRDALAPAGVLALPGAIGGGRGAILFPGGGDDRFVATAFWPMLAVTVAAVLLLSPRLRIGGGISGARVFAPVIFPPRFRR